MHREQELGKLIFSREKSSYREVPRPWARELIHRIPLPAPWAACVQWLQVAWLHQLSPSKELTQICRVVTPIPSRKTDQNEPVL